ncbi:MAG: DUF1571 domain-containing protein [Myxococcaceae bacterium]|nr:DUF1571 domain-containing protein [Myxococcaceae bacterium]MCA3012171.1 DUF1571 domain-containing protein [Myxococcaceae bacterium]
MSRWAVLAVGVAAVALADGGVDFTALGEGERRALVASTPRDQLERLMKETPQAKLLAMGQRIILGVNTYRYRMLKQERVRGELLPEQLIDVYVREAPFSVRLHYVKGPGAGRKVLFNPSVRADEFRVREAGLLSIAGAIWLSVDSSFAKADSNHTVREAGIGPLVGRLIRDTERARPLGGFSLVPEGWNAQGEYCGAYLSPPAAPPFDYAKTRICTDLKSGVLMKVEGYGLKGELLEKWHFADFTPDTFPADFFDPDKAKL